MADTAVDVVYGIDYILFGAKPANGAFPAIGASGAGIHRVTHIKMTSYAYSKEDDQTTDINCEDLNEVFMTLDGEKGKTTIAFESYNFSEDTKAFFLGYEKVEGEDAWIKVPGYQIPELYMEVGTRKVQDYPAKVYQYLPVKVKATDATTLTKEDLAAISFEVTLLANVDSQGNELGNVKITKVTEQVAG